MCALTMRGKTKKKGRAFGLAREAKNDEKTQPPTFLNFDFFLSEPPPEQRHRHGHDQPPSLSVSQRLRDSLEEREG